MLLIIYYYQGVTWKNRLMLEGVGTQTTEDHSWWVSNCMKNHTQKKRVSESILPTLYCWIGWPSEGQKLKKKSSFMLRCCIITVYPKNSHPSISFHQKKWDVTVVTRDMSDMPWPFSIDKATGPSKAYYNVYRDQGLRQASFRLIGQTLTPFFNDTDLDAGRAYGYQAPERGRWWSRCWRFGCWGSSLGNKQLGYESMYGGKLWFCDTLDYIHAFQEV